jgi:hypothetical protein
MQRERQSHVSVHLMCVYLGRLKRAIPPSAIIGPKDLPPSLPNRRTDFGEGTRFDRMTASLTWGASIDSRPSYCSSRQRIAVCVCVCERVSANAEPHVLL